VSSTPGRRHAATLRESFTRQAATFEDARLNFAFTDSLSLVVKACSPRQGDVALDVAAGTGLVARALAPLVSAVVAVDITPEMLERGKRESDKGLVRNVIFQRGDVNDLPFLPESFTLVVSRFSLHHLEDPGAAVRELARVCRRGGRVVIFDLVASDDPEVAARQDDVERRRDPAHLRNMTKGEVVDALVGAGLIVGSRQERVVSRSVDQWLEQADTEAYARADVRRILIDEINGGPVSGMRPSWNGHTLQFTQTWFVAVGTKG
jgi:ubiquinone/menaquinone biosynthesis C-methylase UbiE